jgi:Icc-related predicted phosphoesterase
MPMLAVLGNHDVESGAQKDLTQILDQTGVKVLDGDSCEVHGIGFVGVKGFAGGFGARALQPWGEEVIKRWVHEAVEEALKLESALARLRTTHKIVLLHYSPIRETVEGEPAEIMPFLGSSRLEEPLNRYPVTVVFHGHAHHGCPKGHTKENVPVYNVAMPLLQHIYPDRAPFRLMELPKQPSTT